MSLRVRLCERRWKRFEPYQSRTANEVSEHVWVWFESLTEHSSAERSDEEGSARKGFEARERSETSLAVGFESRMEQFVGTRFQFVPSRTGLLTRATR